MSLSQFHASKLKVPSLTRVTRRPLAEAATRQQSSVQPPTPGLTATSAEGQGAVRAPRRRSIVAQHAEDYDGSHSRRRTGSYLASSHASDLVLDGAALRTAGQMYLTWCHNQPLCFFQADTFLDSLKTREAPLLLALQALALRFPPGALTLRKKKQLADMANAARQLAMDAIANSQVELSTIQTLCFLSLVDLAGELLPLKHESLPAMSHSYIFLSRWQAFASSVGSRYGLESHSGYTSRLRSRGSSGVQRLHTEHSHGSKPPRLRLSQSQVRRGPWHTRACLLKGGVSTAPDREQYSRLLLPNERCLADGEGLCGSSRRPRCAASVESSVGLLGGDAASLGA